MKYNKEHVDPLIQSLKNGDGRVRACKLAGIGYDAFLDWMERKPEFSEAVKKAEADGNNRIKDMVKRRIIEDKSWQSAAWWLERNFPEEYRQRAELQMKDAKKQFEELFPSDEELTGGQSDKPKS